MVVKNVSGYIKGGEEVFFPFEQFSLSHVSLESFEFRVLIFPILDLIQLQLETPHIPILAKFSIWLMRYYGAL